MDDECEKLGTPTPFGVLPPGHSMWARGQMLLDRENAAKKQMYEAANNLIDWGVETAIAERGEPEQKTKIRTMAEAVKSKAFVEKLWIDLVALCMGLEPPPDDRTLFPLLFEIDSTTNEATGTVHFYCSNACREQAVKDETVPNPHAAGADKLPNRGLVCESCGTSLC